MWNRTFRTLRNPWCSGPCGRQQWKYVRRKALRFKNCLSFCFQFRLFESSQNIRFLRRLHRQLNFKSRLTGRGPQANVPAVAIHNHAISDVEPQACPAALRLSREKWLENPVLNVFWYALACIDNFDDHAVG